MNIFRLKQIVESWNGSKWCIRWYATFAARLKCAWKHLLQ